MKSMSFVQTPKATQKKKVSGDVLSSPCPTDVRQALDQRLVSLDNGEGLSTEQLRERLASQRKSAAVD